jgi:hypothetical protein
VRAASRRCQREALEGWDAFAMALAVQALLAAGADVAEQGNSEHPFKGADFEASAPIPDRRQAIASLR